MKRFVLVLTLAAFSTWAAPAHAQLFFGKKTKVNPSQRVPELILTVKTDADERKRARAAEELRDYDTKVFTEIVPVLVDVLLHDKKQSVRGEALGSLARIRPVSQVAGQAMEKAVAADEAWRLRLQARAALTKYHLAGYSSRKSDSITTTSKTRTTEEPPLGTPPPLPVPRVDTPPRPLPISVVPAPLKTSPTEGPSLFP